MAEPSAITRNTKFQDLTGRRFGKLSVISYAGRRGKQSTWNCACDCGVTKVIFATNLVSGISKTCGCSHYLPRRHASSVTGRREYKSYNSMMQRCYSETYQGIENYSGRGIKVCDRWRFGEGDKSGFDCFLADMGERPAGTTLDRRDNDGDYEPDNCRWATSEEQMNNRRACVHLTVSGITKTVAEWAKIQGMYKSTINRRLARGVSPSSAIIPTKRRPRKTRDRLLPSGPH